MTNPAKEYLLNKGYNAEFGARELKRTLQSTLEDVIVDAKIDGEIKNGDSITITVKKDKLEIKKDGEKQK